MNFGNIMKGFKALYSKIVKTTKKNEKFCDFQTNYASGERRYHCLIGDWQNNRPVCSYYSAKEMAKRECGIARCEGELVRTMFGDTNAKPPKIAENFNIIIDVPGFRLDHNSMVNFPGPALDTLLVKGDFTGTSKEILKKLTSALE